MMDYTLNREKFTKKWRGREFNEAVKQMDDFITNPIVCIAHLLIGHSYHKLLLCLLKTIFKLQKFKSNAYAKPPGGKIRIKTEHSVEKNLNIKSEQNVDQIRQQTENATKCDASESYVQEKKRLLDTLTHLKSENQKLTFELKKKSEECAKLAQKHADCKNVIANLVHQKQSLSAQLEQLKTTAGQNNSHENITNDSNPNSSESDVYEVEQILDDKKIKNVRYFLVRWKGFSKKDDTWERKSNLMCPDILEEYEAKKREMS